MKNKKSVAIIFICHDNISTKECLKKIDSSYILFVGDNKIDEILSANPRVVVARELSNNIESEKKLLTFTAWYAIIKNNLFSEYEYICLFEYDIVIEPSFETTIRTVTQDTTTDVVSFMKTIYNLLSDHVTGMKWVNEDILDEFIRSKNIEDPNKYKQTTWFCTTNHCIRRNILHDFVDWYYPNCLTIIKAKDLKQLSWYHERIFFMYMNIKELKVFHLDGILHHLQKCSHDTFQ